MRRVTLREFINEAISLKTSWMSKDWVDGYVMKDIQAMKTANWRRCAQDRNKWKSIVEQAKTHIELWRLL
jgi:hypothetical protein